MSASTSPDMQPPVFEPVSAEVAALGEREQQQHELDKVRDTLRDKALLAAGRAEGAANVVAQQVLELGKDHGGRIAVVESDIAAIKLSVKAIERVLERSAVQQALYALTALVWLGVGAYMLYDRFLGAGAG